MKRNVLLVLLVSALILSCSKDDNDNNDMVPDANAIIGSWQLTELNIDDQTASDDAKFGKQILDFLTGMDCYILTFEFNVDMSLTAHNAADYLEINATPTGLDVPCPTQSDSESSTYTYDGMVLTTVDENGQTVNVDVTISGDTMTVDATDLDIPNFNDSGELIFQRQ